LHVRRTNDPFARRVFDDLRHGDEVVIVGPAGTTVYDSAEGRKLVFVAWDEGFAPIGSLVQHALSLDEEQPMRLFRISDDLPVYRDNQCRAWADAYDGLDYTKLAVCGDPDSAAAAVVSACGDIAICDVYAAGPARFLDALHRRAEAVGMPGSAWHGLVMDRA
jgi:CDP-4-dehydro-6-deoxyglucose reductase